MTMFYTIVGNNQLLLATYPDQTTAVRLWYVKSLSDLDFETNLDDVLLPYAKKIATYAAKCALLSVQDPQQLDAFRQQWRDDLLTLSSSSADRNESDPVFAQGMFE